MWIFLTAAQQHGDVHQPGSSPFLAASPPLPVPEPFFLWLASLCVQLGTTSHQAPVDAPSPQPGSPSRGSQRPRATMLAHVAVLRVLDEWMGPHVFEDIFAVLVSLLLWGPLTPVPLPQAPWHCPDWPKVHRHSPSRDGTPPRPLPPPLPWKSTAWAPLVVRLLLCLLSPLRPARLLLTRAGSAPFGWFAVRTGLLSGMPEPEAGPYQEGQNPRLLLVGHRLQLPAHPTFT